jgi:hypothetical protein
MDCGREANPFEEAPAIAAARDKWKLTGRATNAVVLAAKTDVTARIGNFILATDEAVF